MNITLSKPLLDAYGRYCGGVFPDGPFSRKTLGVTHRLLPRFADGSVYVSSFGDYLRLIAFAFSKENTPVPVYFNGREAELLDALTERYNAGRSNLYSLFLCSMLFSSGTRCIRLKDFFSYFLSDRLDYSYPLLITSDIYKLYSGDCGKQTGLRLTALIRAACFYYQNIAPGELLVAESKSVTVDNKSTGWKKFYARGSPEFKNYLFELKRDTGKTINCIVNCAAYQFLSAVRSSAHEK